jgi:hypothetical protein
MDESIIALPRKDATLEDIIHLEPRHDLFTLYRVPAEQLQPTEVRPLGAPLQHPTHTQLLVHMKELRLRIGEVDPFFLTAAVYDLDRENRRRVSEFFHYELNISSTLSLVKGRPGPPSPLTSATHALFSLTHQSPTLFLVIRIETVLHGPYEQAADPYFKVNMKQKQKNKLISFSEDCARVRTCECVVCLFCGSVCVCVCVCVLVVCCLVFGLFVCLLVSYVSRLAVSIFSFLFLPSFSCSPFLLSFFFFLFPL